MVLASFSLQYEHERLTGIASEINSIENDPTSAFKKEYPHKGRLQQSK